MQSLLNNEGLLMHKGFPVDEEVWLTRDGVANGEDDVVNRALAWINSVLGVPEGEPRVPKQFTLSQNYPNPFNPNTTIKFELPRTSNVTLTVHDILGREVSLLVNERQAAGVHEVKFDASGLASGVYLYRLQTGDFTQTKRLLLLK